MNEKFETCVPRVKVNKNYLLINIMFDGLQVLFINTDDIMG